MHRKRISTSPEMPKGVLQREMSCPFIKKDEFNVEALEKFIEESSMLTVTLFNKDPNNHPYVIKFFNSKSPKFYKCAVDQYESHLLSVVHSLLLSMTNKDLQISKLGLCKGSCIRFALASQAFWV